MLAEIEQLSPKSRAQYSGRLAEQLGPAFELIRKLGRGEAGPKEASGSRRVGEGEAPQ